MTRANPHHLARLFLPLDTAHLGRADAPSCDQSKSTFLLVVKGTGTLVGGSRSEPRHTFTNSVRRWTPSVRCSCQRRPTPGSPAGFSRGREDRSRTDGSNADLLRRRGPRPRSSTTASSGAHARRQGSPAHAVKRTNDLVKGIFEVVELRGLEPLTFSLRTRRATDCAIAPRIGVGRSARRLYHRQAEATWRDSPPASAGGASDAEPGASAVTGPASRADVDPPGPDRSIVRTVRGANGFET
jgi:hypothetical protein